MALFRTIDPTAEPVTLAEAKAHLRVDDDEEDGLIGELIRAARRHVEADAGLALIEQGWRTTLDNWPGDDCVAMSIHPLITVVAVTAFGPDGAGAVVDPANYALDRHARPARLAFSDAGPALRRFNGVEIDLTAGFGATAVDVPDEIKRAMLLLVAHFHEFRAAFGPDQQPVSIPAGYDRLIAPWRARRL
ncbi:MAG: phage head-tail connector protein [Phyllobacteriaceae bacterium]|nr:phage head-tail connector protein [Phyllobacteriaceae bacterium]